MFVEIITVGDELLIGQVVDTNSAWIGKELNKFGFEVVQITSVRDREEEILEAIELAMKRAYIVLMTGGLGPTKDDITKLTLCKFFHTELVFSEEVYKNVEKLLTGPLTMNALNRDQALVPKDCLVINNRVGTASVSWFQRGEKVLVSMPGVPQEMKIVMSEEVIPRLCQRFDVVSIIHKTFTVRNHPESTLAIKLSDWEDRLPGNILLAYLPAPGLIRLRLTARAVRREEIEQELERQSLSLHAILGADLIDECDLLLEQIIGEELKDRNLTICTAESCTGGTIAARITSVAGSSGYYKGGIVAYANEVKIDLLHVDGEALRREGAVSEQVAIQMAKGAMNALKTDFAIATTGIAGPDGGTPEKPVGTVWIAIAYKDEVRTFKQESDRGREMNVMRACNKALIMLSEILK